MFIGHLKAVAVVLLLAIGAACAAPAPPSPAPSPPSSASPPVVSSRCQHASAALVSAIETGLTVSGGGSLSNAYVVKSSDFPNLYVVAAKIAGEGLENVVGAGGRIDPMAPDPSLPI